MTSTSTPPPALPTHIAAEKETFSAAVDTIKLLALLAIERAKSGHPGMVLGCAPLAMLLARYILRFDGNHPDWPARDRFVLSAGHGSMLLYSLGYLFGFPFQGRDLARFRSLGSMTAGHPEHHPGYGIETTTGPLGQGFSNAVGMALEQKLIYARLTRELKDPSPSSPADEWLSAHAGTRVFTLMGDGCMMEGVTQEAASLAGHLALDNLVALYDANNASIDGKVDLAMSEDIGKRFLALGWDVETVHSGGDLAALLGGLERLGIPHRSSTEAAATTGTGTTTAMSTRPSSTPSHRRPKLLICHTRIGAGLSDWEDDPGIHGRPAGEEAIAKFLCASSLYTPLLGEGKPDMARAKDFVETALKTQTFPTREALLPASFYGNAHGVRDYARWEELYATVIEEAPRVASWVDPRRSSEKNGEAQGAAEKPSTVATSAFSKEMQALRTSLLAYEAKKQGGASRELFGEVFSLVGAALPNWVGGSADLVASTKATLKGEETLTAENYLARNIAFGVREHGMGAIGNGLALGGRMLVFTSTFLVFSDYMRPAIRLAALMQLKHLFVFSHDSFHVGEDGPTHQPVEHVSSLRLIPGLRVVRPANDREMAFALLSFLEGKGPMVCITSRQGLNKDIFLSALTERGVAGKAEDTYESFNNGVYTLLHEKNPAALDLILMGSGSEVGTLAKVQAGLEAEGYSVRLLSAPILERGEDMPPSLRDELFLSAEGKAVPCYFAEAVSYRGMASFLSPHWTMKTQSTFGQSAPGDVLEKEFGFDAESMTADIKQRVLKA